MSQQGLGLGFEFPEEEERRIQTAQQLLAMRDSSREFSSQPRQEVPCPVVSNSESTIDSEFRFRAISDEDSEIRFRNPETGREEPCPALRLASLPDEERRAEIPATGREDPCPVLRSVSHQERRLGTPVIPDEDRRPSVPETGREDPCPALSGSIGATETWRRRGEPQEIPSPSTPILRPANGNQYMAHQMFAPGPVSFQMPGAPSSVQSPLVFSDQFQSVNRDVLAQMFSRTLTGGVMQYGGTAPLQMPTATLSTQPAAFPNLVVSQGQQPPTMASTLQPNPFPSPLQSPNPYPTQMAQHQRSREILRSRSLTPQPTQNQKGSMSAANQQALQEAEDDREIARCLIQRMASSIDWETEDREMLHEKQEALRRASKRLEETTSELEKQHKRVGFSVAERLRRLEVFEAESSKFSTVVRKLKNKLNQGEERPVRSQEPTTNMAIRLPKMELKTFDGNVLRWHEFWECFEHGVHNLKNLPDHQKLQYLKSSLRSAAFVTISDLDMKGDNYQVAVKLLKERYGHKNVLRKAHLDGLEKISMVNGTYELQKLKRLYEEVESHYKALLAIEVKPGEYEATMVPKLMNKIPVQVRIRLTQEKDENEDISMDELVNGLRRTVKVLEKCGVQTREQYAEARRPRDRRTPDNEANWSRNTTPSGATLVAADHKKPIKCDFCLSGHQSVDCRKYHDVKARTEVLKKFKRCFKCLKTGHMMRACPNGNNKCKKCLVGNHHEAICAAENNRAKEPTGMLKKTGPVAAVAYQTVMIRVMAKNGAKEIRCRALLDSGSARSFITKKLADELKSTPEREGTLQTFEGLNEQTQQVQTEWHKLKAKSLDRKFSMNLDVKTLPAITTVGNPAPLQLKKRYEHLSKVFFTDITDQNNLEVQMLLGSEHLADIQTGEIRKGKPGEPVAVKTKLGWTLMGPTGKKSPVNAREPMNLVIENSPKVKDEVAKLWDLETLGIKDEDPVHMAFNEEVKFQNGRYSVPLPWREGSFHVPQNKALAEGRLKNQLRKLKKQPKILEEYDAIIQEQLKEGIVEPVPETPTGKRVTYIPHQAVLREEATTTKLRVVYDASAKTCKGSKSLNECLHTGPSLNPLLYSVLLKFRMHETVLIADIKQAFLQIEIDPGDRDALRFLWVKDIKDEEPEIKEYRFTRAIFGAGPSPFILGATIRQHLEKYKVSNPELVEDVEASLYVDDYISGDYLTENSYQNLQTRKNELQDVFQEGGFTLRKWFCSDPKICREINPEATTEERKVLGVTWDPQEEVMKIDLKIEEKGLLTTKRNLLSSLAAVFDPLGVAGPIVLKARVLFQGLCAKGVDWDEEMSPEDERTFKKWMADLKEMKTLSFPRFVGPSREDPVQCTVHVFCDASSMGYCATVYIAVKTEANIQVKLLTAKCRLAPLKKLTIPRLELLSARTGAKLLNTVFKDLKSWKIERTHIWLDSLTALYWIANKGAWKPYVNNRVKEIHELVTDVKWQYCPTDLNPADIGTRGATAARLQHSQLWWQGPEFLKFGKEAWPEQPKEFKPAEEAEIEEKNPNLLITEEDRADLLAIIDINRFSCLTKLLRCTARVLRFAKNCRKGMDRISEEIISAEEMKKARNMWIEAVQRQYKNEVDFEERTKDLGIQMHDDGLIRCHGRFQNAQLTFDEIHPVLLPPRSKLTSLVIRQCHDQVGHGGVGRTLAEIRSQFWILRGRQIVKSVIRACRICKIFSAKSLSVPRTAPLPNIRASRTRPFQHTGVDFAGPLYVKQGSTITKAYITLFSCATTRAVHLELAPDMTAETFMMSLEKFFSAWGVPNLILSDNAATFKSTAMHLRKLKDHPEVQTCLQSNFLTWKFNLSLAPWWGGHYERLVGMTKVILKKILGKAALTYPEMEVLLKKTQAILNNRPLVYQGEELEDEPLTPNHLIFGHQLQQMPEIPEELMEEGDVVLRRKHIESKLSQVWLRWNKEYLVGLREFHKNKSPTTSSRYEVRPGDIVLIENKNTQRGMWKKAKVLNLITGADGVVRGVAIQVIINGNKKRLERAVQQIFPLEICAGKENISQQEKPKEKEQNDVRKSRRVASMNAKAIISTIAEDDVNHDLSD